MLRKLLILILAALTTAALACMWDYDTFAVEASGKSDLVSVLAGRFDRNPPLYYEMRLEHSLKEIEKTPEVLDLYDNAAVAAARLGKDTQAIEIIEKKRPRMKALPEDKDAWYRYHANLGTFYAHRALTEKGEARWKDLRQGEKEIARAIEINPDAHFGREKYQLYVIQWLLDQREEQIPLWDFLEEKDVVYEPHTEEAIKGLAGLIQLGAAWESLDIWGTLAVVLSYRRDGSLSEFALARIEELEKAGKKSTKLSTQPGEFAALVKDAKRGQPMPEIAEDNKAIYADLRKQADEWHANRTAYMTRQLEAGKHPDWDKDFWSDWKDEAEFEVPTPGLIERIPHETKVILAIIGVIVLFCVAVELGRRLLVKIIKIAFGK